MSVENIIQQLTEEIARLTSARNALSGLASNGRTFKTTAIAPRKTRTMSAAARRKIAAAQRARWAKVRAGKKAA